MDSEPKTKHPKPEHTAEESGKGVLPELSIESFVELLLFAFPYGAEQMNLPLIFWLGFGCWIVGIGIAVRMFWIFPLWRSRFNRLEKGLISFICIGLFVLAVHDPVMEAYRKRTGRAAQSMDNGAPSAPYQSQSSSASVRASKPIEKPKVKPPNAGINGSDNTLVGAIGNRPIAGNRNTIVGTTDAQGNTILNHGGTAIGNGASASPTGIAIGAGANAGSSQSCPNGICIGGDNSGTAIVNNGPIPRSLTSEQRAKLGKLLGAQPPNFMGVACMIGDSEGCRYRDQIQDIFVNAGWTAGRYYGVGMTEPVCCVSIAISGHDKSSPPIEAIRLLRVFQEAGFNDIAFISIEDLPDGTFYVLVGDNSKPTPQ